MIIHPVQTQTKPVNGGKYRQNDKRLSQNTILLNQPVHQHYILISNV